MEGLTLVCVGMLNSKFGVYFSKVDVITMPECSVCITPFVMPHIDEKSLHRFETFSD